MFGVNDQLDHSSSTWSDRPTSLQETDGAESDRLVPTSKMPPLSCTSGVLLMVKQKLVTRSCNCVQCAWVSTSVKTDVEVTRDENWFTGWRGGEEMTSNTAPSSLVVGIDDDGNPLNPCDPKTSTNDLKRRW